MNVLIINAHQYYPFSEGKLNVSFTEKAKSFFLQKGYDIKITTMQEEHDVNEELNKHIWADFILIQAPVNWMGMPWSFKKYIDIIYSSGTNGILCQNDGRSESNPEKNYGTGGQLNGTKYMLSVTFNAPKEAFNNPEEYLFQGKSVDDLFFPMHMNMRFFAAEALPTFAAYDVMKNPTIEDDFKRFDTHLQHLFT
ncbi:NAD(P)H-dependent oxidoreductase [Aquimarina rhabdastrellae]